MKILTFLFERLAIDPLWALYISGTGGLLASGYGLIGTQHWTVWLATGLVVAAALYFLLTYPAWILSKSRERRRRALSSNFRRLIERSREIAEGSQEHQRWEQEIETALREFDDVWADEFWTVRFKYTPGEILRNEVGKITSQMIDLRREHYKY
jgi:hypothetical protein